MPSSAAPSAVRSPEAGASSESTAQRVRQGLNIAPSIGNLTRAAKVTEKAAYLDVAFNTSHKNQDGTFKNSEPTFAKVVLVHDARTNLPEGLTKGARVQVEGAMETVISKNEQTGKVYNDLQIKVFGANDLKVLPKPAPRAAAGGAPATPAAAAPADAEPAY